MSVEIVRAYLKKWGREGDIKELQTSTATSILAAEALGVVPGRIAKSLTINRKKGGGLLVTASGDARLDNRKFRARFGETPKMMNPEQVLAFSGFAVGGVSPFGLPEGVEIFLDISLKRFETVFPACGSANSMIETTIDELELYSRSRGWVDVCS